MMKEFRLDDEVLAQVAKLIQLAMLTGTDVIDNLRMLRVSFAEDTIEDTQDVLVLSSEYRARADDMLEKLLQDVEDFNSSSPVDTLEV
tara:strand:- start:369 stop:632 length:264 start_codon:yes stop_codon:yes gene_type:complete